MKTNSYHKEVKDSKRTVNMLKVSSAMDGSYN